MKRALHKATTRLVAVAVALAPLPRTAAADDAVAKINRITAPSADPKEAKEVSYPTSLVQLVTSARQTDVSKNTPIQAGEAVLTRSANTHVKLKKDLETLLYSNTFVRFDGLNVWLLRHGRAYVVSKRGKLEIVAEALGRILVASKVYLRIDGTELLAFVTEGNVVLEANARTLSLRPGQAGRIRAGEGPEPVELAPEELADLEREIQSAESAMKGGGGGGLAIAALLAAAAAGAVIASQSGGGGGGKSGAGGTGGTGGTKARPDLVPAGGEGGCRFDPNNTMVITVRNQGQADAPASVTRVEFEQGFKRRTTGPLVQDLQTPSIRAGDSATVRISPNLVQSLRIQVTVDSSRGVDETNEGNNTGILTCPAPIG
jgi:hypothetical protein